MILIFSSNQFPFLFQTLLLIFLSHVLPSTGEPLSFLCIDSDGNIYNGTSRTNLTSTYRTNLNNLLSSLPNNTMRTGFYNATIGENPNQAYALALCRGDTKPNACQSCLKTANQEITRRCPEINAVIWYDNCHLRYSNESFFGGWASFVPVSLGSPQNVTDPTRFDPVLDNLLRWLVNRVVSDPSGRMYATGVANVTGVERIYGLTQCTRDLSSSECRMCLQDAIAKIPSCCYGKRSGRVLGTSCNVRYDVYKFFDDSETPVSPSPPLLPPPPTVETDTGKRLISLSWL